MNNVLQELDNLHLNCLTEEWAEGAYYSEFLEFGEFPSEYECAIESLDIRHVFESIMKSIDIWRENESSCNEEKSWAALSHEISHQKLLAVLGYYIDHGSKNVHTKEYRNNALLASRLYYKFLSVPGYKAYHIYHSQLFTHTLACLGFPKAMCENEENYCNSKELSREVNSVIRQLQHFVADLKSIIESLHLNPDNMNFEDILSNLVDITGGAIVNKLNIDKLELANISRSIYQIIDILLCNPNREPNPVANRLLFKCILPKLVSVSVDSRSANNLVRASYVTYIALLLTNYGKAALPGFTVLLQHLCYTLDGLERAEVRVARVSLVLGLMSLLPPKPYRSIVMWLLKLSTTSKVAHRQIAMEMLSKLLCNDPEETNSQAKDVTGSGRSLDKQESEKSNGDQNNCMLQDTNGKKIDSQSTNDESMEDDEHNDEEDMAVLNQREQTVPHGEILRAVYERVDDVSSTLRARALNILTDCLGNERDAVRNALNDLDSLCEFEESDGGGERSIGRVMAAAARCVCDERAVVRRAAAVLVHRRLTTLVDPPATDLAILEGLCRDGSIIVRTAAITALGELITQRTTDAVIDAFLSGPMHQLSDPETKIQEHVVTLVQQVLFDRLQKHSSEGCEDKLPWRFLAGITRHNMRRHLQKTCMLLQKTTTCISHRTIDMLSTHLGAVVGSDERDLHCLVLMSSIARHVDYSDVTILVDFYYRLAEDTKAHDSRIMPLTLELLSAWSQQMTAVAKVGLRDHLLRRLDATSLDTGCRIACAQLAAYLDPNNLQWATELMQRSERRSLARGMNGARAVEEWVHAADVSLVSPVSPRPALLKLFLDALASPPSEWADSDAGAVVAAVGRLCVRSRAAAGEAARVLATLLQANNAPLPARHNALLALADICTRYTCIVEPLMESVCGCVSRSAPVMLRRAAARALTRLLLGGYLRLRTPLYYRYCALLADKDHDVREPAEYYVSCCLTADAIYHHFVDCVLHYNKDDKEPIAFDARQLIYDVMLQRMSLVQKLNVQCRLAREVLQHCADVADESDASELPPHLHAALLDSITLLCGPRMKLPKKPQNNGDPADMEDLQERVTTNIVSHKMKCQVAEILVPAVLRLYGRLGASGGQVAAYLVRITTELLNDYRAEIEKLIDNDEELVDRVRQFQETIGEEPSFGNARNLVTASAPPDPETPRAPRRRCGPHTTASPAAKYRKRAIRIS